MPLFGHGEAGHDLVYGKKQGNVGFPQGRRMTPEEFAHRMKRIETFSDPREALKEGIRLMAICLMDEGYQKGLNILIEASKKLG